MNIWQRQNAVMAKIGPVKPDGQVTINGKKAYDYISHDAVTAAAKPLFVEFGIGVCPTVINHTINGNRTELTVRTRFINIDTPDDFTEVETLGYGVDSSDKAPGKALSYAIKGAYQKFLMMNSADDAGGEQIEHTPADDRVPSEDKKRAYEAAANTYKAALDGAPDIKELRALKKSNEEWLSDAPEVTQTFFEDYFKKRALALDPPKEGEI